MVPAAQAKGDLILVMGIFELARLTGGEDMKGAVHVGKIDDQAHGDPVVGMAADARRDRTAEADGIMAGASEPRNSGAILTAGGRSCETRF
jgi:hypothetical protein